MTALYISTKLFNPKMISIGSLAELSRGEFEIEHIAEMERIILKTLNWNMNPPTAQSFIERLLSFVQVSDSKLKAALYHRALFFAELAVYDYSFVVDKRLFVAMACMLNAMEGMNDSVEAARARREFLQEVSSALSATFDEEELDAAQSRLWFLYSCSAQLSEDDALEALSPRKEYSMSKSGLDSMTNSPVSVHPEGTRFY
jgi:hypothetical protein